jgi:hypothetical protein
MRPLGDQGRQVVARLAQRRVGVADLLVEDSDGVGVHHRRAGLVGGAAEQRDQLGKNRHR